MEPPPLTQEETEAAVEAALEEPIPAGEENKVQKIKAFIRPGVVIAPKKQVLAALVQELP